VAKKRTLPEVLISTQIKKGQVLNPKGENQYTGKRRFLAAVEAELSKRFADHDVAAELARRLVRDAMGSSGEWRKFVAERLWDKVDKVEVSAKVAVTDEAREEAQRKLDKLLARKEGGA